MKPFDEPMYVTVLALGRADRYAHFDGVQIDSSMSEMASKRRFDLKNVDAYGHAR